MWLRQIQQLTQQRTHVTYVAPRHMRVFYYLPPLIFVVTHRRLHRNNQLLVRMERRGSPLRILLEACSFIFGAALAMTGGPAPPGSPTFAFDGSVVKSERAAGAGAGTGTGSSQEAWEAFNRHMDEQDKAISEAAAAAATSAGGAREGGGVARERELPASMMEVLKVSLSLLRRFSSRNLALTGAYASSMHMWPSGHPQVCWRGGEGVEVLICRSV